MSTTQTLREPQRKRSRGNATPQNVVKDIKEFSAECYRIADELLFINPPGTAGRTILFRERSLTNFLRAARGEFFSG